MKKSLLFVLTLLLGFAVPQFSVAQNQNRTMIVHLKGEATPLELDMATIDSISFAQAVSLLTFEFVVENISNEGADFTIIPSDKTMPYYAMYVQSTDLKGMSDAEIIAEYSQGMEESDLLQGDFSMISDEVVMSPDTEYTLFAFGYQNGRPNAAGLFKTTFRTLSEKPVIPGPVAKIWGEIGDKSGNHKDSYIKFGMQCTSEDAGYAECLVVESTEIDIKLERGYSLEEIAQGNRGAGYVLDRKELALFNGVSFELVLNSSDGVKPETSYTCLLLAENYDGGVTVLRQDVKTEASDQANVKPEVIIETWAGNAEGKNPSRDFTLKYKCTTKNAAYCESFILETSLVESIGMSIEDLIALNEGGGRKMTIEELDQMNSEGVLQVWEENNGDTSYTVLILVKNIQGERLVVTAEVTTEPDTLGYSAASVKAKNPGILSEHTLNLSNGKLGVKVNSLK